MIQYPGHVQAGRTVDDLVELVGLFPTLCDLAGVTTPEQVQGRTLRPTLEHGAPVNRNATFCLTPEYRAIRTDGWRLTLSIGCDTGELYDMESDPWEHRNLYHNDEYAAVRARLLARLVDFHAATEEPTLTIGGASRDTEAARVHRRRWWEAGGSRNPSPLAHLGGPGYPLDVADLPEQK